MAYGAREGKGQGPYLHYLIRVFTVCEVDAWGADAFSLGAYVIGHIFILR